MQRVPPPVFEAEMADRGSRRGDWIEHVVQDDDSGSTVEQILRGPMGISGRMVQRLTRSGGISLNRRATHLSRRVKAGERIAARIAGGEQSGLAPVAMELSIVLEDDDLLAVNKPPFLLVHPTSRRHDATLAHGIAHHLRAGGSKSPVRPVHRIDRDTSGLVLFAKSAHAHHRLDVQLRDGLLEREYVALVEGTLASDAGEFREPIGPHPHHRHLRAVQEGGSPAHTRFHVLECFPGVTLLALRLETGRTHQIRVHAAHAGHPVLGDRQYGAAAATLLDRPALHSARLTFSHPISGRPVALSAPLPGDLLKQIAELR